MPFEQLFQKVDAYLAGRGSAETLESILAARLGTAAVQDEPREIVLFIVGTGRDAGLDRMVQHLTTTYSIPIRVVSYKVFETEPGRRFLVRELSDAETTPPVAPKPTSPSVEQVCAFADASGVGAPFRAVLRAASDHGLYARPYKTSVMYAPPSNRTRCLFTVWATTEKGTGKMWIYVAAEAFAQFFGMTEEQVVAELGGNGYLKPEPAQVGGFVAGLHRLFEHAESGD